MTAASSPGLAPLAPSRRWRWLALLLVALLTVAYTNSLTVPFFFDDAVAVLRNPTIRQLWPLSGPLSPPADGGTTTGRPVLNLSLALNYAVNGETVAGYHLGNLFLHAMAALLLMGLVRRTLQSPRLQPRFGRAAEPLAFAVAGLWALHPLQTESVVGIAQRSELLAGLFYLLTLYCFARGAESRRPLGWFVLAVTACLLGMGAKEIMVTAPLMVLLYDRTFVARSFAAAWRLRRGVYVALALTWLWLGWLVVQGAGSRGASAGFGLGLSPWSYLLQQCEALLLYLRLSFWPHPLIVDYGTGVVQSLADVWWQGSVVLALLGFTAWALWRRPAVGFLGAWFFVILAPSSSVVPLVAQTMAEHRMYLPLVAIMAAVALAAHRWLGGRAALVLGAVLLVWGGLTLTRNRDYQTELGLWADTVARRPQSARAQLNFGFALQQAGRTAEARDRYQRAIALQPGYVVAHYHFGVACLQAGQLDEAVVQLGTAVRLAPDYSDARVNLGVALVQLGRGAKAVAHFEAALRLQPTADVHCNLAVTLIGLGREAEAAPHLAAAADFFEADLRHASNRADLHANLGNVRLLQHRTQDAIREYETALQLDPTSAGIRANLEAARSQAGSEPGR